MSRGNAGQPQSGLDRLLALAFKQSKSGLIIPSDEGRIENQPSSVPKKYFRQNVRRTGITKSPMGHRIRKRRRRNAIAKQARKVNR